jgi:hypothetical protein
VRKKRYGVPCCRCLWQSELKSASLGGRRRDKRCVICILIAIIIGRAVSRRIAATNLTLLTSRRVMHCAESVVASASWASGLSSDPAASRQACCDYPLHIPAVTRKSWNELKLVLERISWDCPCQFCPLEAITVSFIQPHTFQFQPSHSTCSTLF